MKRLFLALLLALSLALPVQAAGSLPPRPDGDIYVNDYASMLSSTTRQRISQAASRLDEDTTAQVAVVTVESLDDSTVEEYANKLFQSWGIGDKTQNNGILILIAKQEHKARIEVGYGLEGRINDAKAGRILRDMTSHFKTDDYDQGVLLAFSQIATEVAAKYHADPARYQPQAVAHTPNAMPPGVVPGAHDDSEGLGILVFMLLLCAGIVIAIMASNRLLNRPDKRRRRGTPGGWLWGGGFGGGGGGGSFGGGSSGGGGASGGW